MSNQKREQNLPLLVLLGPTAVGKTALSLALCQQFQGEVIGADSRQIYRHMDIGTAKPTPEEQTQAQHHLVDIRNPDEVLSLSQYQRLAYETIDQLHLQNHLPLLVGGTSLYIRAVVQGLRIPEVPPNPELRVELEAFAQAEGWEALFKRLEQLDPATAEKIDPRNIRRVVRALEIVMTTGRSKVELEGEEPPPYRILQIGLDRSRENLYQRIDQRVDQMINDGLIEETATLLEMGYAATLPAMASFGYREIVAYLRSEMRLDEAIEKIKTETHRFVRHQYTWFRRMKQVHWFDVEAKEKAGKPLQEEIGEMVWRFINGEL